MRSSPERVPTSVQPHPQAPSGPSGSWGPARAAARKELLALQKPAGRRRPITTGRQALRRSRSAAAVGRGSARPQSRPPAASSLEARQMPAASCTSHAPLLLRFPPRAGPRPLLTRRTGLEGPTPSAPGCPTVRAPGPGALTPSRWAPACRRPWPAILLEWRETSRRRAGGTVGSGPRL